MKELLNDRTLFVTVLGLIGECAFPPATPYVAAIGGAYFENRAASDILEKKE